MKRRLKNRFADDENLKNEETTNDKNNIQEDSNVEDILKILDRIDNAGDQLKESYYSLFDNLNALADSYGDLYKQIQMVVKLPTNEDADNICKFNDSLHDILSHFRDKNYLNTYIKK